MKEYKRDEEIEWFKPIPFNIPRGSKVLKNYVVEFSIRSGPSIYSTSFSVYMYTLDSSCVYVVKEPYLGHSTRKILSEFMDKLGFILPPSEVIQIDPIGYFLSYIEKRYGSEIFGEELPAVRYFLLRDILGYWIVDPLIRDGMIEDISCEGPLKPVRVWHRNSNYPGWMDTNVSFEDESEMDTCLLRLVHRSGKSISVFSPIVDTVMNEGYRLVGTLGKEVSRHGSSFTIRKQRSKPYTISELIKNGTITKEVAAYLWMVLDLKGFIFICGPPASGKTTLLNSLVGLLNPSWKIVTIEDTPEISLPQRGWKALHTRILPRDSSIGLFDLVKLSLRERPDFVVLGETRGAEAQALFQSALAGSGCISTFHAPDYESMKSRLTEPPINVSPSLRP
jgi:flagellar protein FlaI